MAKSLQEIHKHRQQEDFVGREGQLSFFEENLLRAPEDPLRRFIIGVSGQGGVGKTWLLRQFRRIAEEKGAATAWTDEAQDSVPEVMGCLADQFAGQGHPLKAFAERYRVYRQRKQEIEADPDAPQGLPVFIGRTLAKGGLRIARRVPVGGVVADFVDEEAFASLAGDFASYVARKVGNKDEVRLVLEPVEVLTPLLLSGLRDIARERTVALFFDTYERTGGLLDSWLRDLLEGRYGDVPPDILLVIAGRNEPDRNLWAPYEALLARLPLEPFTEKEAREYLARKGITDERVVEVVLSLSGRLPLLLATLAVGSPDDPGKVGDPSGEAVGRFLKWVEDPKRRQVALDAALPRRLNRDVVAVLVGEEEADALFSWLRKMPFLVRREDCWSYHEVVRTQMLRHKRRVSPQGWAGIHGQLAVYYEKLRDGMRLEEEAGRKNEIWQEYALEALYHQVCWIPHQHLSTALNGFLPFLRDKGPFARLWAETILQAGRDTGAQRVQEWGRRLLEGLRACDEARYEEAISLFSPLKDWAELDPGWRPAALDWQGNLYFLAGQYEQALINLNQAIQLRPGEAEYWAHRGSIHREMKHYNDALADFSQAIELDSKYAWAVVRRGEIYRLMGRYDEALTDFSRAIELQPVLARAFVGRGTTYRLMERYDEALSDLNRAIELQPDYAWAFGMRGVIYSQMGRFDDAIVDFNRAVELQPDLDWVFALRGETCRQMGKYEEALADFDRAVELKPGDDRYLYSRALVYRAMGQMDQAQADLTAAIQRAQEIYREKPQDWRNTLNLALYHLVARETDEAERLYREALDGGAPPHRLRDAIHDLDDFLALFPDHPHAQSMQARLRTHLEETYNEPL